MRLPCVLLGLASVLPLIPRPSAAMEVHVAPLAVVDDAGAEGSEGWRPERDLLRGLMHGGTGDALVFLRIGQEAAEAPASLLEAALLCERQGCRYLLYGYLKRTPVSLSAELKLLDHERGRLAAVFFGSDDPAHYERLMREMAAKVRDYFFSEAGLPPPQPADPSPRNLWELSGWLGYWTPLGGEWDRVVAGVATAGLAIRLLPADPLFFLGSRGAHLALGLEAEYGLGMNEPGYESFFLHAARLRVALEAVLDLPAGHAVGLGAGMLVELDTAVQDRKYSPLFVDTTLVPGLSLAALYRYRLSGRLAVGAAGVLEIAAYEPALVMFSPRLFVTFRKGSADE